MNRRILLVTMAAGLTTAGCGKSDWHDFNSAEGKYSVQFPGKPEEETTTYRPGPQVHAHLWPLRRVFEVPKATFLVSFIDLPPEVPLDYSGTIRGMAGLVGGTVTKERDWALDGNKGKEVEMSITSTPFFPVGWVASAGNKGKPVEWPVNKPRAGFASSRMVVINNRLYQIVVIGEEATFDNADVKKFFDSFKLNQ
jgi:hypothetical protein